MSLLNRNIAHTENRAHKNLPHCVSLLPDKSSFFRKPNKKIAQKITFTRNIAGLFPKPFTA